MNVKNIGNTTACQSHTEIFISPVASFTGATLIGEISIESLTAGAVSNNIQFVYPIPFNTLSGTNYILIELNALNEVNESNLSNNNFISPQLTINSGGSYQNIPYPVIFIHGLVSTNETWSILSTDMENDYGWSFGGNMNFCLNQDGDTTKANAKYDYRDWTNISALSAADLYTVNFNVDTFGNSILTETSYIESNESAIVKQGLAVRDAVKHVLQVTGRDKVILVGHSMGGLAAREYLQNQNIWQADGQHHVAKLLTIGTPHGGSNTTVDDLGGLYSFDEQSEAVRDLRTSYDNGHPGVYLFGGTEKVSEISESLYNFGNVDVNCNGVIGDSIIGLNKKSPPLDFPYTCIIGNSNVNGTDGLVTTYSANLNNYYPVPFYADTFILQQPLLSTTLWHLDLPNQTPGIMKGLDEPNEHDMGYDISSGQLYYGIISTQSLGDSNVTDYDNYKINMDNGSLNIKVYNIPLIQFKIEVFSSNNNSVFAMLSNGKSYIDTSITLGTDEYYIELSGTPTTDSWLHPYAFYLTYPEVTVGIKNVADNYFHSCSYPNPFQSNTTISFTLPYPDLVNIKVYNMFGQLISTLINKQMNKGEYKIDFNAAGLAAGMYFYTIQSGKYTETHKLILRMN
jgi:pimeloyl-ACP methyl ester carboxylesterase